MNKFSISSPYRTSWLISIESVYLPSLLPPRGWTSLSLFKFYYFPSIAWIVSQFHWTGETGDAQLLQKFDIYLQSSKFYQSRENNNNSKSNKATSKNSNKSAILSSTDFSITHYAGTVKYSIINFVEKNKDVLYSSLSAVSFNSSCHVLKQCFPEGKSFNLIFHLITNVNKKEWHRKIAK